MKYGIFSLLFLFSISLSAKKKIPEWKPDGFQTSQTGIRYSIVQPGKGDSIKDGDLIFCFLYRYDYKTKKYDETYISFSDGEMDTKSDGSYVTLDNKVTSVGIIDAFEMLRSGGTGYFIIPPALDQTDPYNPAIDSTCCFIRVVNIAASKKNVAHPQDAVRADTSITFRMPDPDKDRFGDSILTTMQLVETPFTVYCHGSTVTMQAVKFSISYFDNGTKHKNVLVFIDCPDKYGKDFFVPGRDYMITAIPLMENHKDGKQVQDSYTNEKDDSYYCLRIRKMN